jgi:hypothetical protein
MGNSVYDQITRDHAVATIIAVRFRQQQDRLMNLQPIHRALK